MIVVTGAAGKTGKAVIECLLSRKAHVRGIVHRPEQRKQLLELGVQEAVAADMANAEMMVEALQGARAIYHICPNMHPEEFDLGLTILTAARRAGIEHFVYHSVLHPQVEAMPHHWQKMRLEEKLFESGLMFTILQPAAYMQNILPYWKGIVREGMLALPYAAETRINMVHIRDVAEVAAIVLTDNGHAWATYELCGPENLSQNEVASIIGRQLAREVAYQVIPIREWQAQARSSGLGGYALQTLSRMFQYYEQNGFYGNSQVLGRLLGRPPRDFAQYIAELINDKISHTR